MSYSEYGRLPAQQPEGDMISRKHVGSSALKHY